MQAITAEQVQCRELNLEGNPVSAIPASSTRTPGFPQGLFLLLPITLAVIGVSVFTSTVRLMQDHFRDVPRGEYLVNYLQTMPGLWIVLFSPIAGWLADRFGRRNILMTAMVLYSIAGVAPFWMGNIYAILVTRCVVGMCESVALTLTTTMLCDYFKGRSRERWLASQTGVASLSALVIIPLGGWLGDKFGWQGPFLVYSYSAMLVIFVAIFCWEPSHEEDVATAQFDVRYQTLPWGRILGIMAVSVVGSVMFYSTITQNSNALASLGITNPAEVGRYATFASLGVPIGTILFWGLGRLHIGLLLFIDFLFIGVGFQWMAASSTPMEYVWAANVQQLGCGLVLPTVLVWATRGLAYRIRGRGNGLWQASQGVGLFISGATLQLMGNLLDNSILRAFGVLGRVALAAAALALIGKLLWGRKALPATESDTPVLH
jgi:MFS family permease